MFIGELIFTEPAQFYLLQIVAQLTAPCCMLLQRYCLDYGYTVCKSDIIAG